MCRSAGRAGLEGKDWAGFSGACLFDMRATGKHAQRDERRPYPSYRKSTVSRPCFSGLLRGRTIDWKTGASWNTLVPGFRPTGTGPPNYPSSEPPMPHYPHRISKLKRVRAWGFRARMKTKAGRKIVNRKRRFGRRISPE